MTQRFLPARFALALAMVALSCSPATISRIGPPLPPKPPHCEVEVLEGEKKPSRPYRDVGLVELENCQDYRSPPCLDWLEEAACELGGDVTYLPDNDHLGAQTGPITFRLLVAAYVSGARGGWDQNERFDANRCDPQCDEDDVCLDGSCVPKDCEEAVKAMEKAIAEGREGDGPDRCVE